MAEGCPIHPHRNGPYKPCVDPYGSNGSTTGVYSLISGTWNVFMARAVIYGLSIRTDRTDRQQGYTNRKTLFTDRKSDLISGTYDIFMARAVLYGLSIRTDRTDRQQGYTVCKECFTVRKSHLINGA